MKKTSLAILQIGCGILAIYALARAIEPKAKRPEGWFLLSPPHEATVLAEQANVIWAGGKEGVFAVDRTERRILAIPAIQSRDLRGARALLAHNDGLLIGCRQGLMWYNGSRLQTFTPPGRNDIGPVTSICSTGDGSLWIGVEFGAWRIDQNFVTWRWFGQAEGLSLPSVDIIYQRREGDIWFASNAPEAAGLFRFDPRTETFSNVSDGLTSHAVNDVLQDHSGVLWIATGFGSRGAAARLDGEKWTPVSDLPDINGEKIRSLFEDNRERLWFCSEYNGVAIRDPAGWKRLTAADGLPGSEVKHMLRDSDGTLWLATERGLGCLQNLR